METPNPEVQIIDEVIQDPKMLYIAYMKKAANINKLSKELFDSLKEFVYSRENNPPYGTIKGDVTKDNSFTIDIPQIKSPNWFSLDPDFY
jgi:hypothetical protein